MDTNDLKLLLERYWQGETSTNEEDQLKAWFQKNPNPEGLESEAQLFTYYSNQGKLSLPGDFDDRIIEQLSEENETTIPQKTISLWSALTNWKVAAVISGIIVASIVLKNPFGSSTQMTDTYDNPQDAYEATKAILLTISSSMNKGKKHTQQLIKFSEAQDIVSEVNVKSNKGGS